MSRVSGASKGTIVVQSVVLHAFPNWASMALDEDENRETLNRYKKRSPSEEPKPTGYWRQMLCSSE